MNPDAAKNDHATPSDAEGRGQPNNLRNILVAIDFSDFSKQALDYALILAEKFHAKITLVHVVEAAIIPETLMISAEREVDMRTVQERREQLESLRRKKIDSSIPSEAMVKTGEPWKEIVEEAKFLRAELIITASHGRSALKDILLGNTAERVMRHAPCSVLITRQAGLHADPPQAPPIHLKRILAPVDFSPASEIGLASAAMLAKLFGAEIVLAHVIETDALQAADGKILKDAEEALIRLGQQDIPSDIPRQIVVKAGSPFKAIVEAAKALQADLIIITSHGHKGLNRPLPGR